MAKNTGMTGVEEWCCCSPWLGDVAPTCHFQQRVKLNCTRWKLRKKKKKHNTYVHAWRSVACYWHCVFIRSDNICFELRRLWAGGNCVAFEVNRRIKQRSSTVVWRCSLVQRDGRNRSGERPTSRADPGTVSRYLLPCVPPPYAVIPKDRQACAIWPHFGFPGHILGIQTMPPPRLSLPSALSPSRSSLRLHFIPAWVLAQVEGVCSPSDPSCPFPL